MSKKRILFLIPARKGSKGLPNKNMKILGDFPLIKYSFDFAKSVASSNDEVCVSTNDETIFNYFEKQSAKPQFIRPDHLSTDTSTSDSVIEHALGFFKKQDKYFEYVLLLQPTSPFRLRKDFFSIFESMDIHTEMVVSVVKCKNSPYFNQFKEINNENLVPIPINDSKIFTRRQDLPSIYAYNGAYYFFHVKAFEKEKKMKFNKIKKFEMPYWRSLDIDNNDDWELAKFYLSKFANNSFI